MVFFLMLETVQRLFPFSLPGSLLAELLALPGPLHGHTIGLHGFYIFLYCLTPSLIQSGNELKLSSLSMSFYHFN